VNFLFRCFYLSAELLTLQRNGLLEGGRRGRSQQYRELPETVFRKVAAIKKRQHGWRFGVLRED